MDKFSVEVIEVSYSFIIEIESLDNVVFGCDETRFCVFRIVKTISLNIVSIRREFNCSKNLIKSNTVG
jgi:hypothetical protein